jgi:acyl transferase domain-containing protein
LLTAAGQLFINGAAVDWPSVLSGLGGRHVELPTYGFARQRFWLGSGGAAPAPVSPAADLAEQLQALAPEEQHRTLVELVCSHAAAVLGHSSSRDIDVERAFSDIGFESLTGVELRNRLKAATGLALSRTLIFDFPNPSVLADHLRRQLLHDDREDSDDEKLWSALKKIPLRELRRTGLLDKLLLLAGESQTPLADREVSNDIIDSLSADALIAMALESDKADDAE